MVEVVTRVERAVRLAAPLEAAWALLQDVPRWGRLFPHVEAVEPGLEAGVFHWRMEPLGPPGGRVRVEYACRYVAEPAAHTLRWSPVEGVGTARFEGACALAEADGGTAGWLDLGATLWVPAPSFLAGVVRPAVSLEIERMTDTFVGRLGAELAGPV